MDNERTHSLYLMLSGTETSVAKMIRKASKCRFTHASISLNRQLTKMYSFARRRPHNVLISGFIKEDLTTGVYSWNMDAPCVLYEIKVSKEAYERAEAIMDDFMKDYKKHTYNIIGLWAIKKGKVIKRKYKYACSQFVAHVLNETGEVTLRKNIWITHPDDLIDLDEAKLIYQGTLKNVNKIDNVTIDDDGNITITEGRPIVVDEKVDDNKVVDDTNVEVPLD